MRSVVYVLDRSISMGPSGALARACREVLACLEALPPGARFQVVPYNRSAAPLCLLGRTDLVPAEALFRADAARLLGELRPTGGTDHVLAVQRALLLRPDMLYLVTDADDLTPADVQAVCRSNRHQTPLHVLELGSGPARPDSPLGRLAGGNLGRHWRLPLE